MIKDDKNQLYLITGKALPKILLLVLKCKELIENKNYSITEATKQIGISRTTYYKYSNEIFNYNDNSEKKIYKIDILNIDKVGTLSNITKAISKNKFNILTINQNNPIKGNTKISISVIMTEDNCNITKLVNDIKKLSSIKEVRYKLLEKD